MDNPSDLSVILQAAVFAAEKHRDQRRKDACKSPYIQHPLNVAKLLTDAGIGDVNLLVAAILHDTVEDTQTSFEEIADRFGQEAADLVAEVTDDKSLPRETRKELQISSAPHKSASARMLKIADKISNLRDIDGAAPVTWDLETKQTYLDWAEKVVAGCRGVNQTLDDWFDETVRAARERLEA